MLSEQTSKTPISELGEFALIERLTQGLAPIHSETKLGVGDDACVLSHTGDQVISTDTLAEGIHFNLQYAPLKHLGYKSVVVSISDIVAMGATPKQILVAISVSNRFTIEALDEIYRGIHAACKNYRLDLVGGDTTSSQSGLIINVTAIGEVEKDKVIPRSGAKMNDLLVVSGNLGGAYMGLQVLERERAVWLQNPDNQPDLDAYTYLMERQLKPEARLDILRAIKEKGIEPTSMIDISDGLSSELLHIAKASKQSVQVYEDKIPIDYLTEKTAEEFNLNPTITALNGGEDYELLFSVSLDDKERIEEIQDLTIIGYLGDASESNGLIAKGNQTKVELTAQGWQAFGENTAPNE